MLGGLSMHSPTDRLIPISDHFDGEKFFNPHAKENLPYSRLIKWLIKRKKAKWPKWVKNDQQYELPVSPTGSKITVTFLSHASFLVQTSNVNILIDPVYSKRVGPLFFGPRRVRRPGIPFSQLSQIDIVLISHNHYDHLDIPTLKRIKNEHRNVLFITGLGNKKLLNSHGIKNVAELDWWESLRQEDMDILYTPAKHFSSRTLFDRNKSLWGGFIISGHSKKIFFTGDSGYGWHFKEINTRMGAVDLALLPIGAYKPRWFMKPMHMNPEEAVHAHFDLDAKLSIPMHYGTFCLSEEPINEPLVRLFEAIKKYKIPNIKVLDFGQTHIMD